MTQTQNMTEGKPLRLLFFFALPLMFGNVFQQMYTVVDTLLVGRGVGLSALSAIGTVDWLIWMMLGISQGFTQGFSVRMSQKYGEGDFAGLRRHIGVSVRLSVYMTLLLLGIGQGGIGLFFRMLHIPAELYGMAETYTRIMFAGIPAVMFFNFTSASLRAVGNSKTPLYAMLFASVLNIGLDMLAIFVFSWGLAGAAWATVLSQCAAGAICVRKMMRVPELRIARTDLRPDFTIGRHLLALGLPVALQNSIISLGGMAVQSVVNGFALSFIAGFTATNKIYGVLEIAAYSYGFAVTTYVGQNYGAGRWDRIRQGMRTAAWLSLVTSAVTSVLMLLVGRPLTMLFISSPHPAEVLAAGDTAYRYLEVMCLFLWSLYILDVYRAALQGMGDTIMPMLSGVVEFIIRVGVAVLIGKIGYENGIFFSECGAWFGAMILLLAAYAVEISRLSRKKGLPKNDMP